MGFGCGVGFGFVFVFGFGFGFGFGFRIGFKGLMKMLGKILVVGRVRVAVARTNERDAA